MRFEQTIDALNHARDFHSALGNFYQTLGSKKGDDKAKMLLDYMAENEKTLAQAIDNFEQDAPDATLKTWFQYTNDADILKLPEASDSEQIQSIEDIVELATKFSDQFIALYSDMANHSDVEEVKEVFENLAGMQTQEKRKLSTNVARLMDI